MTDHHFWPLKFNRLSNFSGYNGWTKMAGLTVECYPNETDIRIYPCSTKGVSESTHLQIPAEHLDDLIRILQEARKATQGEGVEAVEAENVEPVTAPKPKRRRIIDVFLIRGETGTPVTLIRGLKARNRYLDENKSILGRFSQEHYRVWENVWNTGAITPSNVKTHDIVKAYEQVICSNRATAHKRGKP